MKARFVFVLDGFVSVPSTNRRIRYTPEELGFHVYTTYIEHITETSHKHHITHTTTSNNHINNHKHKHKQTTPPHQITHTQAKPTSNNKAARPQAHTKEANITYKHTDVTSHITSPSIDIDIKWMDGWVGRWILGGCA